LFACSEVAAAWAITSPLLELLRRGVAWPDVGGASRLLLRERRGVAIPLVGWGAFDDLTSRSGVLSRLRLWLRGVGELAPSPRDGSTAGISIFDFDRAAIFLAHESCMPILPFTSETRQKYSSHKRRKAEGKGNTRQETISASKGQSFNSKKRGGHKAYSHSYQSKLMRPEN